MIRKTFSSWASRLHRDQRGLEGLEYLLIAALVVIASAVAWGVLGRKVSNNVNKIANAVTTATDSSLEIIGYKK